MNCMTGPADNSVEPVVIIGGVVDSSGGAVRLNQTVVPFNFVTNSLLGLLLDVVGVVISNCILELVVGRGLRKAFT
jgi:hypothetical protein